MGKGTSPSVPAPTASSSSALTTVPVLPQNMAGMVPLSAIIHRMTNEAFSDLSNLSDVLPSMNDAQKKIQILQYALSKREQFIKLLVLTKWAKNANKFQQCQNIVGFLRHENELFTRAVGGLFETYRLFGRARVRNFDIPTAIDVLTTGTYQRLPSRIKQAYVSDDAPARTDMTTTLEKLDDVIRMRLLCDELVPPSMKYTIGGGKVKFLVENEFEVTLTVSGPGSPREIPWRIVSLKILVKPGGGSFQGFESSLADHQLRTIINSAQKEMDSAASVNPSQHIAIPATNNSDAPANQALLRLYDYLHMISLHLLIELVYIQAQYVKVGWNNKLVVELNAPRTLVKLKYWSNGINPAAQSQPQPPVPPPKRRASASPSTPSTLNINSPQNSALQQEHYLEVRIEERENPKTVIPDGLAGALVDPKSLGYPKAFVKVVWSQVVKGIVSEDEVESALELDPSNIQIEKLLLKTVNVHTRQVMQGFYNRLCSHIERLKSQTDHADGAYFSKNDIKLDTSEAGEQQGMSGIAGSSGPQALLVRLKGDRWIRIRIDIRTGQVVVREVGKTGEGVDLIITSFQNRLNENADNIVDALISLRFSMTMVELESLSIILGLQPYRRIALTVNDVAQFGTNIQQLLFLQYPQHPRHYLVVGVIDQKFCVWLIEVTLPTSGITLTLKSIAPVYWQELRRQRSVQDKHIPKSTLMKRKSVQFDIQEDESDESISRQEATIDHHLLSKLEALCRVRICHTEVKSQLQEHGIQFRILSAPKNTESESNSGASQLANMIPLLRLDPDTISRGITGGMFLFVGAKLTGWWDNQRETCNFVVQAKFSPESVPTNMESGSLDNSVHFHESTGILSFSYKTKGSFIRQFKEDWEKIVRTLRIIGQLHAPTIGSPFMRLQTCHLHNVKLVYFERYTITLRWASASSGEKKSSTGIVIPSAPRFRQGMYEIDLSVNEPTVGLQVNPHHRMKYFLQDMFNREADLHVLMNTLVQTCSILEIIDRLENTVKEDSMGLKLLSVIPRSAHHIRVVYGSKFALDIRAFNRTHISIYDASFPSESYGTSLPPPPAPATAPGLVTPGRIIPPTTKGHLHYAPISNLQGAIDAINVGMEDERYNRFETSIANTVHPEGEPYELLPLSNGLICSRSISGRVLYHIAMHIETLL
ncbi:mediator complex subunit [Entomortierella beljakovae]|nr:mediator complex subunit [Entomortierella beljakovae]